MPPQHPATSWRRGGTTRIANELDTGDLSVEAEGATRHLHQSARPAQQLQPWNSVTSGGRTLSSPSAGLAPGRLSSAAPLPAEPAALAHPLSSGVPAWLPATAASPTSDPADWSLPVASGTESLSADGARRAAPHGEQPNFEDVLTLEVPQTFRTEPKEADDSLTLRRPFGAALLPVADGAPPPSAAPPYHSSQVGFPASALPRISLSELSNLPPPGNRTGRTAGVSRLASTSLNTHPRGMAGTTPLSESNSNDGGTEHEEENRSDVRTRNANGEKTTILRDRQVDAFSDQQTTLPAEKGFPIQIGSELFRLSGASIMSDAPSYFSRFFEDQLRQAESDGAGGVKTLYIDRDPITFQDIALHLQGYFVKPRDATHYVKLFADAQFYGLPRMIKQLFESDICIRIGEREFQVSRDLFSAPGNTPNYFTLGFAMFAPTSGEVFPGLDRANLFRPPSIDPPALLSRSSETFVEILHLLRGYPLAIRSPEHRAELLRDCRYYHFKGLEQTLVPHSISHNAIRGRHEILIRLEDIRQSGVSFVADVSASERSPLSGYVNYARPYVDEHARELILEVGDESTRVDLRQARAEFFGKAKARITSLFQVVATKMNLPSTVPLGLMLQSGGVSGAPVSPGNTPLSDDLVKVRVESDAFVLLDGEEYDGPNVGYGAATDAAGGLGGSAADSRSSVAPSDTAMGGGAGSVAGAPASDAGAGARPRKRRRRGSMDDFGEWIVRRGQWRLRVQPRPEQDDTGQTRMEIVLLANKLDAISGQRGRNAARGWLNE